MTPNAPILDPDETPHAPVPLNTMNGVQLIRWPGDEPLSRRARMRRWVYEHSPQLIILGVAALLAAAGDEEELERTAFRALQDSAGAPAYSEPGYWAYEGQEVVIG